MEIKVAVEIGGAFGLWKFFQCTFKNPRRECKIIFDQATIFFAFNKRVSFDSNSCSGITSKSGNASLFSIASRLSLKASTTSTALCGLECFLRLR